MIWIVLSGTYVAGMIAGVALVLWAERLNEPKRTTDSITDNHRPDHTYAP